MDGTIKFYKSSFLWKRGISKRNCDTTSNLINFFNNYFERIQMANRKLRPRRHYIANGNFLKAKNKEKKTRTRHTQSDENSVI